MGQLCKVFTFFFWAVVLGQAAWAAPSVQSVLITGATITVQGGGFGVKTPAAPLLWESFEDGTAGQSITKNGKWVRYPSAESTNGGLYDSKKAYSGSLSAYSRSAAFNSANNMGHFNTSNFFFNNTSEVYYSYRWMYASIGCVGGVTKMGRILGDNNNYNGSGVTAISSMNPSNGSGAYHFYEYDDFFDIKTRTYVKNSTPGTWARHEMFAKLSSPGVANGAVFASVGFAESVNNTAAMTVGPGKSFQYNGIILGLMSTTDGASCVVDMYVDDVYLDKTRARVELGNAPTYSSCTNREPQIPSSWSNTSITTTLNKGRFNSGDTAYLFVIDANGVPSPGYPITIGAPTGGTTSPPTDNAPSIAISSPTSSSTFTASNSLITIAGSASDDKGIASVTWSSTLGGSGTATNLNGTWSSWQIANLALSQGNNPITVTVTDTAGQKTSKTLTLSYSTVAQTPPPLSGTKVWDAVSQNGDSAWKSSSVTYTVRLLVKGSVLTQGGNQVSLGFQGRSTGDYTIRKVSIAQRDLNGGVGDVVDSTWSRVTFDGKTSATWGTDAITVPAGQEKFSDPIPFPLMAGQDYYVTFKIDSPSVYLNPPSGYQELYFQNTDRTDDVDWSGNGHAVTQDYHALGSILAEGAAPVRLTAPKGVRMVQAN